jgi:hypothetical protein
MLTLSPFPFEGSLIFPFYLGLISKLVELWQAKRVIMQ